MDERRIMVSPFEMISILTYEGTQQVNKHGTVKISGIIKTDKKDEYIARAEKEIWVQTAVMNEDETETHIFCGVLEELNIECEGDLCRIELSIVTGTKLMDYRHHTRSFQKSGYTYGDAVKCCNQNYPKAGAIITAGRDKTLPGFVMQYRETDWAFLKRMAGSLNTIVVPSYKTEGEKYFFGIPEKQTKEVLDTDCYTVRRGVSNNGIDTTTYIVESRKICNLGDTAPFLGKKLCIWRIETVLKGNELYHTYYLRERSGMESPGKFNQDLIGLSLLGEVTAVEKEQVKIKLDEDENEDCGKRWFRFSTVYSSADGTGWYCMPEIGDRIRLYFPTELENEVYVSSAFHENQGDGIRVNPDYKIWRNKEEKEIRLTPDKVLITNNNGMSVELSDQKGITIKSNKSIRITAGQTIGISSSSSNLELDASGKILLKQGNTVLEMADGIHLSGGKINMQ